MEDTKPFVEDRLYTRAKIVAEYSETMDLDELMDYLRHEFTHQIAELLAERLEVEFVERDANDWMRQEDTFEMKCAVMTLERYRELLEAEKKLQEYKLRFLV